MTDMDVRAKFGSRAMMGALEGVDPAAEPRAALSEAASRSTLGATATLIDTTTPAFAS